MKKNAPSIIIDKEAHEDEYYIDTICVAPEARGKGIGTLLLQFAIEETQKRGYTKLSLNVETEKRALVVFMNAWALSLQSHGP